MRSTVPRRRVLFLGLDAMDPDLVQQWSGAGILPTFRSLFERSTFGSTQNPPALFVGAVWPSFFTGVSPAKHGRYCYEQIVTGTYSVERFSSTKLKRPPFWTHLSSAGRRVVVVDVPKSPQAANLNGIQLRDWGTHDPDHGTSFQSWPPELAERIISRFGVDQVGDCNDIARDAAGIAAFGRRLKSRVATKTAICSELLDRADWDLFLGVFAESHCVGHQCWTLHDRTHRSHDQALAQVVGDPIQDVYVALDAAVGELLSKVDAHTTVFVLASHGMGPHYDATFMLDDILERLDPQPGAVKRKLVAMTRRYGHAALRRIGLGRPPSTTLPVAHRRCFAIPNNDVYGGIRVNLVGREPHGRVRPGQEVDALFAELRRQLRELVNVHTGEPVVRDVLRLADLYEGECMDDLPDFCVEWNREAPISCVSSPAIGTMTKEFGGVRNGDHKAGGFFWVMGPGVAAGRSIAPIAIMDLPVTMAALLEVPLPNVDGRPIAAIVES